MDTEKDFEEATGTGIDDTDIAALDIVVDDDDPIEVEEKILPEDIDPEVEPEVEEEDDIETEIANYIFESKYDE